MIVINCCFIIHACMNLIRTVSAKIIISVYPLNPCIPADTDLPTVCQISASAEIGSGTMERPGTGDFDFKFLFGSFAAIT